MLERIWLSVARLVPRRSRNSRFQLRVAKSLNRRYHNPLIVSHFMKFIKNKSARARVIRWKIRYTRRKSYRDRWPEEICFETLKWEITLKSRTVFAVNSDVFLLTMQKFSFLKFNTTYFTDLWTLTFWNSKSVWNINAVRHCVDSNLKILLFLRDIK